MKKNIIIFGFLLFLVFALLAEIMPVKTDNCVAVQPEFSVNARKIINNREVPEWEWDVTPQDLLTNYADYFQCYNQTPIALQPEENGGGIYIMYRVKDQAGNSEISYSYIDNTGTVQASQGIGEVGYYPDAQVDQNTGDVFGTWHVAVNDGTDTYDCMVIYDLYHVMNSHGLWKDPVITILDSDVQDDLDPTVDDEFIWPQAEIGPSPIAGKQRIYIIASNHIASDGDEGNPSENVMIMMADFETGDLEIQSNLDWSYTTIPVLDAWNAEDPYWYRPFKSFLVRDNQLILMGYKISGSNAPDQDDQLFCFINDNYGEGDDWIYYYQNWQFDEDNPSWIDPESGETMYMYPGPSEQEIINTGHFNLVATENNTKVAWPGAMGITFEQDGTAGYYYPLYFQVYPKTFSFNLMTEEFSFCDVYPPGANPNDEIPMKPWDLDEDGEYDDFYDDGMPMWFMDWPIFHYDSESAFHYNEYFLTTNEDNGWMAYIWVDGMMATESNEGTAGYEDWVAKPEIAICISNDWGTNWSDPIFMNANPESDNYIEELDGMIPCFAYPGDKIEDDGAGYGILHLFFLDDNDYGSFHSQQHGLNNGSTFEYAAMRIYFGSSSQEENELVQSSSLSVKNYPNPFNPETTIQFEVPVEGNVVIDIYNVRGQLVKENLVNDFYSSGIHYVIWDGTNNNRIVSPSGIYFYKMKFGKYTSTKKMILMK